jgi:hypothetical protein
MSYTVITNVENKVVECEVFSNGEQEDAERRFMKTVSKYGVEVTDVDMENGYVELECGTTICLVFS